LLLPGGPQSPNSKNCWCRSAFAPTTSAQHRTRTRQLLPTPGRFAVLPTCHGPLGATIVSLCENRYLALFVRSGFSPAFGGCEDLKREFTVDQRASRCRLITLTALMVGASALPKHAAGQVLSNVVTVSLVATVPAGARFLPTVGGEPWVFRGGAATQPAFNLAVNAPYRLLVRTDMSAGSAEMLFSDGRPGLVRLDGVRRSLAAAGVDSGGLPVTVDVVLDPTL